MSSRLFKKSSTPNLRQAAENVYSYTMTVFKFGSDHDFKNKKAMDIIVKMAEKLAVFIEQVEQQATPEWIKEFHGKKMHNLMRELISSAKKTSTLDSEDFPVLLSDYTPFFRNKFFIKEFFTYNYLFEDTRHIYTAENFRGPIAYYWHEAERKRRQLDRLSPKERAKEQISINLFKMKYDSYRDTLDEKELFNTKNTKEIFIDRVLKNVQSAHIHGYGNCSLMAQTAFLDAVYKTNRPVTYIRIYNRNHPNEKVLSAVAIGDFPHGDFCVVSPWFSDKIPSISTSDQFKNNMSSKEGLAYTVVIKVGKRQTDNFREKIKNKLTKKQYESWLYLTKRTGHLKNVERTTTLFLENLRTSHENVFPSFSFLNESTLSSEAAFPPEPAFPPPSPPPSPSSQPRPSSTPPLPEESPPILNNEIIDLRAENQRDSAFRVDMSSF